VNVALLSHPFFRNGVTKNVLAVSRFDVEFFGQSAHASTAPEQGINALDAMTIFMSGLNAWRQQLPVGAKVHGIITNGGAAANVIPDYTAGFYYVRSKNNEEHKIVERRFNEIAQGAAMIAGCQVKVTRHDNFYSAGKPDTALTEAAEAIMEIMDLDVNKNIREPLSTDFANVCDALPGVNIYFNVTDGRPLALHSMEFKEAAASPDALKNTCQAAAVMTKLTLDYMTSEEFRSRVGRSTVEV
jgi:metal-dependent amidase/aminoacylase/carboxypeptidase family protein